MPTFCRHNRLIQNCPICSREQHVEMRPMVSPSGPRTDQPRPQRSGTGGSPTATRSGSGRFTGRAGGGVTVRKLARGAEDGYRSGLVPGLKSGADAERLAEELAFAATRLAAMGSRPPGLYAEVADPAGDIEERTWLAFLIAYLGPLDGEDPFAAIALARTTWSSDRPPALEGVQTGPRGAYVPANDGRTVEAYRAWAARAGSQGAAFRGEPGWTAQRRFSRVFERLSLPGLHRDARFELLTSLGRLGVYELQVESLQLGGSDTVTTGAKRALGIGDPLLLERRAAALAEACGMPLEALDAGLYNWERGSRATLGMGAASEPDTAVLEATRAALQL
jgi:hypothetical protein